MSLNEYEAEYFDSIEYYSKQLAKLAAENAEYVNSLLKSTSTESPRKRRWELEHNCKEIAKLSDEITSLYNKWQGSQAYFYRENRNT